MATHTSSEDKDQRQFDPNLLSGLNTSWQHNLDQKQQDEMEKLRHTAAWSFKRIPKRARAGDVSVVEEFLDARLDYVHAIQQIIIEELRLLKWPNKEIEINSELSRVARELLSKREIEVDFEETELRIHRKSMEEDLFDIITCIPDPTQDTLIFDLYRKTRISGQNIDLKYGNEILEKEILNNSFPIIGDPKKFKHIVHHFYGSARTIENENQGNGIGQLHWGACIDQRYCVVLGQWFDSNEVVAAYLVPNILKGSALNYLFGEPEENLAVGRNGIPVHKTIFEQLERRNVTFVPVENKVVGEPSEWRFVILREEILDIPLDLKCNISMDPKKVVWKELDNKKLTFLPNNPHRPARRYMFYRHITSHILPTPYFQNRNHFYPLTKSALNKLPRGRTWLTPARKALGPDDFKTGYLRESVLEYLTRIIGDGRLPQDLMDTGNTFGEGCYDWGQAAPVKVKRSVILLMSALGGIDERWRDREWEDWDDMDIFGMDCGAVIKHDI